MALAWHDVIFATGGEIWRRFGVPTLKTRGPEIGGEAFREIFTRASEATFVDGNGIIRTAGNDVLRLDWTTGQPAIRLEDGRANAWPNSEALSAGTWTAVNVTVTDDAIRGPRDTLTADKIIETTAATVPHGIQESAVTVPSVPIQASMYLKAAERTWGFVFTNDGAASPPDENATTYINLTDGTLGNQGSEHTVEVEGPFGPDRDWWRVGARFTAAASGAPFWQWGPATGNGQRIYTGDGSSGIYQTGGQQEAGTGGIATGNELGMSSYVPTTATQVLRAAEILRFDHYHAPQGVQVFVDFQEGEAPNFNGERIVQISSLDPVLRLSRASGSDNYELVHDVGASQVSANISVAPVVTDRIRLLATLFPDGSVQLSGRKNAGTIQISARSAALALQAAWGEPFIGVNSQPNGGGVGAGLFPLAMVNLGTQATLDDYVALLR